MSLSPTWEWGNILNSRKAMTYECPDCLATRSQPHAADCAQIKPGDHVECFMPYGSVIGELIATHDGKGWIRDEFGLDHVWLLNNMRLVELE